MSNAFKWHTFDVWPFYVVLCLRPFNIARLLCYHSSTHTHNVLCAVILLNMVLDTSPVTHWWFCLCSWNVHELNGVKRKAKFIRPAKKGPFFFSIFFHMSLFVLSFCLSDMIYWSQTKVNDLIIIFEGILEFFNTQHHLHQANNCSHINLIGTCACVCCCCIC